MSENGVKLPKISSEKISKDVEPVLRGMEKTGVMIDCDVLRKLSKKLELRIKNYESRIYKLAGEEFNINSPSQMADVLFKKLKLPTDDLKRTKTGISTAASGLSKLEDKHPIIKPILEYRELSKLVSTYLKPLPEMVDKNSRLHTTYGQETSTGRMTSSNPNLQNIPIKGELGTEIRQAFIAPQGCKLISADYSQIELRIVACLSQDPVMMKAFESKKDIHTATASEIFDIPIAKVTSDQRRVAKTVNFGVLYGMSPYGLSQALKIDQEKAYQYIKRYFETHIGIKAYCERMISEAREKGYVETLFGFRRSMKNINSHNHSLAGAEERMAVNAPVQGTAAEVLKLAMIELSKKLDSKTARQQDSKSKLILTVHDELVIEVCDEDAEKVAKLVKEVMQNVVKLCVPLEVEVGIGSNWAEAKH